MHLLGHLSEKFSSFLLRSIRLILGSWDSSEDARHDLDLLSKDLRSVVRKLELEPITRDYICCPSCFKLYPLDCTGDDAALCTASASPGDDECGTALYRTVLVQGQQRRYPTRIYLHHDFSHWLANFLTRPGMEDLLERKQFVDSPDVDDIWGATIMRDFMDKDGRRPFFRADAVDSRYAFSLCMDGFGPYGASSGKTVHAFGIFLVLLNSTLR